MYRPLSNLLRRCSLALLFMFAASAHAGLTTINFSGTVTGYWELKHPITDDFPVGTSVGVNLTYNDSFLGQPATTFFLGMSPAVSGTLNLGSNVYSLNSMSLTYFTYGATINDPSPNFGFHVAGSGPATNDGDPFSGLDLNFGPQGALGGPWLIGFGDPDWLVAHNSYLFIAGDTTWEQRVPAPGTLWLLGSALVALAARQRRR